LPVGCGLLEMHGTLGTAPLRVLHVHAGNMFGGVERILETLAVHSTRSPLSSAFALCFGGRLSDLVAAAGAPVTCLGPARASRPWQVRRARKHLSALIERSAPDLAIVHSAWSHSLFGSTVRGAGCPLVRWLHAAESGRSWQERAAGLVRPDLVICNSHYTCHASSGRYPGVAREVCYAPVAVTPAEAGVRENMRRALETPDDAVVIVMAARMEALKGHATLVNALARLRVSRPWTCWIAGGAQRPTEQKYVADLELQIERLGLSSHVRLLGERSDVMALLAAADIYCQPNEGPDAFGMSFVEALASGLPVVSTRLGAVSEIIDASCGVLVTPRSHEQVAAALQTLIDDDPGRRTMGRAARERSAVFVDVESRMSGLAEALGTARSTALR
jgi:glycosyltransferase involved in cell wall biosynthesis